MTDEEGRRQRGTTGGLRPIPDPTELTSRAVTAALDRMSEYVDGQMGIRDERTKAAVDAVKAEARLTDQKHAVLMGKIDANSAAIIALRELIASRDASDSKAIDKAERSTAETIHQNQKLSDSRHEGLSEQVTTLRDIVNRMDAERRGGREDRTSLYAGLAAVAILISIIVSVAAVISTRMPVPVPVPM